MQRSTLSLRDRAGAILLVLLLHVGIIAGLLTLSGGVPVPAALHDTLEVFDVPPTPPPAPPPPKVVETRAAPKEEGAAAPPARKAEATEIKRPDPVVQLPPATPPVV